MQKSIYIYIYIYIYQEILYALGDICHSETPDEENIEFSRDAKFYEIDCEILDAKQKM